MSKESKVFVCGMLCMAALCSLPIVILLYALTIDSFTDGYTQGKQEGYKAGYVMALVKQKKGIEHDFVLFEQDNGESVWVRSDEIGTKEKSK